MGWFRKINKNGEDYKPIGNVITATSLSVAGPVLADGDVVRVMFTTDIAGSDTSTPLALTWNGGATPIPVKAMKEGSLASVYAHEVATNIFKYISGYVTLEMAFDGTNLVIIGNPVVLSGAGYTIYANGLNEQEYVRNQNILSDWEDFYTYNGNSYTMNSAPYDGFATVRSMGNSSGTIIEVNDASWAAISGGVHATVPFKKGDKIQFANNIVQSNTKIAFYTLRDYTGR